MGALNFILMASAIGAGIVSGSPVELEPAKRQDCTWNDPTGPIDCDSIVVRINPPELNGVGNAVVQGNTFAVDASLGCTGSEHEYQYGGNNWTTVSDASLPWTVDIYNGDACEPDGFYYNTVIKYAGMYIETWSSTRCGDITPRGRRCIIPLKP